MSSLCSASRWRIWTRLVAAAVSMSCLLLTGCGAPHSSPAELTASQSEAQEVYDLAVESPAETDDESSRVSNSESNNALNLNSTRSVPAVNGPVVPGPLELSLPAAEAANASANASANRSGKEFARRRSNSVEKATSPLHHGAGTSSAGSGAPSAQATQNASSNSIDQRDVDAKPATMTELGNVVEVFFATDRLPTTELMPGFLRSFLPVFSVALLCGALFIGLSVARRFQVFWLLAAGASVCLGIMVLHTCIIRWQQYSTLASNAATRFSTVRFDASGSQYPLHVGTAQVSIPRIHEKGELETPSLLRLEFIEDPEKHIVLHSLQVEESVDDWFGEISDRVKFAEEREGFIFIHGYNVRFADALKRTAQLSVDLEIEGPVISYSWPSRGQVAAYTADEATVSWSAPHFEQLLLDLRSKTSCRTFNIVAHSMGNRALLESIERIYLRMGGKVGGSEQPKLLESLVLAAPDIDAQQFESRYLDAIQSVAAKATIYFSEQDRALLLSQGVHAAGRLGIDSVSLPAVVGVEAVHIGQNGLFSVGHSYYGSDPAVIDDIRRVLNEKTPAHARSYLNQVSNEQGDVYWELDRDQHASLERSLRR